MPKSATERSALSADRQRIDRWLWHARVVRTRAAAASLAASGHVRVNGARIKAPSREVKSDDVVTVALDRGIRVLKVRGFADSRGNAETAAGLYEELGVVVKPWDDAKSLR
jgi:ribosome-associated heat shock protein Hsp15